MRTKSRGLGRVELRNLITWLNLPPSNPQLAGAQVKVLQAIALFGEMDRLEPLIPRRKRPGKPIEGGMYQDSAEFRAYNKARLELERLAPARRPLRVLPAGPDRRHGYYPDWNTPLEYGFELLGSVSRSGLLDDLQKCGREGCPNYLELKRSNSRFCTAACQAEWWAEYRKTAEGREEERLRMQRLRQRRKQKQKPTAEGENNGTQMQG